jgi:uncharacterized protein YdbL (DUF1318 family)
MSSNRPRTLEVPLLRKWLKAGALLAALALMPLAVAHASALDDALKSGQVGERFDGYLGIVSPPGSREIQELVKTTNAKRETRYAQVAHETGVSTAVVARRAGDRLAKRAKAGTYIMIPKGTWQQQAPKEKSE